MALAPLVLALWGCPSNQSMVEVPPPPPPSLASVAAATAPVSSGDRIQTTRATEPLAAAPVRPLPLPAGRPIFRDCGGVLGANRPEPGAVPPVWWLGAIGCMSSEPQSAPPVVQAAPVAAEPARGNASPDEPMAPEPEPEPEPTPDVVASRPAPAPAASRPAPAPAAGRPVPPPRSRPKLRADRAADRGEAGGGDREMNEMLDELGYRGSEEAEPEGDLGVADDDHEARNDDRRASSRPDRQREPGPVYDWGGTVYLSNDDSMSLASAQRVLYALSSGAPILPQQVRKHELLNYFSFDTAAPPQGRTFSVLGTARRDGDQLAVALAVRGANPARAPLDLTLVIDRSGSMAAEGRMEYTRRGLRRLVENLQRGDRIDVVLFDDQVCAPIEGLVVGRDPLDPLLKVIERIKPRGSTDLDAGLREAYRIQTGRDAADTHGRNQRVVLITDAELNTGTVSPAVVAQVGEMLDQHDVRLSGIGVGRTFDDTVLDQLTERGRGAYVYLGSEAVVDRVFGVGFDSLVRTVAHDVQFGLDLPESLAIARFYGEESSSDKRDVKPVHFHAGTSQVFLQDLAIRDGRLVSSDPITLRITFRDAATMEPVTEELRTTVGALLDAEAHNVHKAKALMAFSDWVLADASRRRPDCGATLDAWLSRAAMVPDDAEIAYVDSLVRKRCPGAARPAPTVELRVRIDSDVPMRAAELTCGARRLRRELSPADTVARFDAAPGRCEVAFEPVAGATLPVALDVPVAASDLRCWVRSGQAGCG
jgi:Ca-activated chloride channel homolog